MSEIVIRRMRIEDLRQVSRIEKENFSMPWSEKSFLESMEREDTIFLTALTDEVVVGYIGCYCIAGVGEITNVAVSSMMRRRGIGRRLLEALFEEGRRFHADEFFLEVRESNESAIALYSSMGFIKEGIRRNFYERPVENAWVMCKHVPASNSR